MAIHNSGTLTPREHQLMLHDKEMLEMSQAHAVRIKQLDIEAAKIEAKITAWFKLPLYIIKLPVLIVMAVGYCIAVARKHEPSDSFWNFLR